MNVLNGQLILTKYTGFSKEKKIEQVLQVTASKQYPTFVLLSYLVSCLW